MKDELGKRGIRSKIPRNILLCGLVSMFIDMSTEMVSPILPMFLVFLGSTPAIIGVIEGITEGLATFLKVVAGYISDKTHRKKPLAIIGYSAAFFYKLGIILSTTWVGVMLAKIVDRVGKGLRTAPRDSLIADAGGKGLGGKFGLHKMFDMLGSALGVLLAYLILSQNAQYRSVFYYSLIPAAIGVFVLFFVRETRQKNPLAEKAVGNGVSTEEKTEVSLPTEEKCEASLPTEKGSAKAPSTRERLTLKDMRFGKKVWLYLIFVFVFSLGNSSNAFLLLRAQSSGISTTNVLLCYLAFNLVASVFALPCGKLSDKIGRRNTIVIAYLLYAGVYLSFGLITSSIGIGIMFALYGLYQAFVTGAEKALVVEISPKEYKGTALGFQGMAQGLGVFLSSILAGILWEYVDISLPFFFGAALALVSAVAMVFILRIKT